VVGEQVVIMLGQVRVLCWRCGVLLLLTDSRARGDVCGYLTLWPTSAPTKRTRYPHREPSVLCDHSSIF
jgi:hypothetical protein